MSKAVLITFNIIAIVRGGCAGKMTNLNTSKISELLYYGRTRCRTAQVGSYCVPKAFSTLLTLDDSG